MTDQTKLCPFCGSAASETVNWFSEPAVCCANENCELTYVALPPVIWNTRPIEDALRALIGEMEAQLAAAIHHGAALTLLLNEWQIDLDKASIQLAAVPRWIRITDDPATWPPDARVQILHSMKSGNGWFSRVRYGNELRHEIEEHDSSLTIVDYWMSITKPEDDNEDSLAD